MKLGALKRALAQFPKDMEDELVVLHFKDGHTFRFEDLAYIAVPKTEATCIILGTTSAAKEVQTQIHQNPATSSA
jgi:hypothetical protein